MKTILFFLAFIFTNFVANSAELFVRVLQTGIYYSSINNQTQYNTTNIFRFFDLPGGNMNLKIVNQQNGSILYNSFLSLESSQRIVAEIDFNGNFTIIQLGAVNCVNWYTSYYNTNTFNLNTTTTTNEFDAFLVSLDHESFDAKRLEKSKIYGDKVPLTSAQIVEISKKFSFDSNRLDWTMYAYGNCTDKANYGLLKNTFIFQSNYTSLENFIKTQ